MFHGKRYATGQVIAVIQEPMYVFVAADDSEATAIGEVFASAKATSCRSSVLEFIRVLDDVIDLLVTKNIILFTELPEPVQEKYTQRNQLRQRQRDSLNLLEDEEII